LYKNVLSHGLHHVLLMVRPPSVIHTAVLDYGMLVTLIAS